MIKDSGFLYGETDNVVMVLDGTLPRDKRITFSVRSGRVELFADDVLIYENRWHDRELFRKLAQSGRLGLAEAPSGEMPNDITLVAYKVAAV